MIFHSWKLPLLVIWNWGPSLRRQKMVICCHTTKAVWEWLTIQKNSSFQPGCPILSSWIAMWQMLNHNKPTITGWFLTSHKKSWVLWVSWWFSWHCNLLSPVAPHHQRSTSDRRKCWPRTSHLAGHQSYTNIPSITTAKARNTSYKY